MQQLAQFILNILKYHKSKILVAIVSAVFFAFLIFPYGDLSDVVSSQVAKMSGNRFYLEFEEMGLNLLPTPGLSLEELQVQTPFTGDMKVGSATVIPYLPSLLLFKMGFSARFVDFLKGSLYLSFTGKKSLTQLDPSGHYQIEAQSVDLASLTKLMNLQLPLRGQLQMEGEGDFDMSLDPPPRAEFVLNGNQVQMLPTSLNIPQFGPMNLPGLNLSQMRLKGRFLPTDRAGLQEFIIEEADLGNAQDPLSGRIRGKIQLRLQKIGPRLQAFVNSYELRIQLNAKSSAQKDFGLFLSFLDSHKKDTGSGAAQYQFRVATNSMANPPSITTLQNFQ